MTKKPLRPPAHKIPLDLQKALDASAKAGEIWKDITPLARSEFACWVISAKLLSTRSRRIRRTVEELLEGKRRPCCFSGCPHL
ncbi:TPA: hypothetical protein DEB00_01880 [Candidatus Uhrbacteria bacterium]|nr:hypothetical protein [Candidatus Uhrbacteria bacterium]